MGYSVIRNNNNRQNYATFIYSWLRSPRSIGAVIPSSKYLARAMAEHIELNASGLIIELGAGTGVVTKAIINRLGNCEKLLVIERNLHFHNILCKKFSQTNIMNADAQNLCEILDKNNINDVGAIISSLPLLSLPQIVRDSVIAQMASAIGENGRIIQFSYGLKSPIPKDLLEQHNLTHKRKKIILRNFPPAHIWVYQKSL